MTGVGTTASFPRLELLTAHGKSRQWRRLGRAFPPDPETTSSSRLPRAEIQRPRRGPPAAGTSATWAAGRSMSGVAPEPDIGSSPFMSIRLRVPRTSAILGESRCLDPPGLCLPQPHTRLVAVGKLDASRFKGAADRGQRFLRYSPPASLNVDHGGQAHSCSSSEHWLSHIEQRPARSTLCWCHCPRQHFLLTNDITSTYSVDSSGPTECWSTRPSLTTARLCGGRPWLIPSIPQTCSGRQQTPCRSPLWLPITAIPGTPKPRCRACPMSPRTRCSRSPNWPSRMTSPSNSTRQPQGRPTGAISPCSRSGAPPAA
jgi:hypothetical protein